MSDAELDDLRALDNPRSLELLAKIGDVAGSQLCTEHLRQWPPSDGQATVA